MSRSPVADVIVVGLGAFGSATLWQLARRGARVVGIDRFSPPHDRGSSHGDTRITRLAIGEGAIYTPLVRRSHEIWRELEHEHGAELMRTTGGLILGAREGPSAIHGQADFVGHTIEVARQHGIAHEVLGADEIAARFPQFELRGDERGYFEPEAGVLRPERCVAAQIEAARRSGARILCDEPVVAIESAAGAVTIRTARDTYSAARAIVTAGAWVPGLAGGAYAARLRVMRQTLHWFQPEDPARYASPEFPIFIWIHGPGEEDSMYGFPIVDGRTGVKVATEQYRDTTDPDAVERDVSAAERRVMFERHVAGRLRGLTADSVHAAACLYTVSPDANFIVDHHPLVENVAVVSACSGHGFKHSAALGEALARHALGGSGGFDLAPFSLARFARAGSRASDPARTASTS